MISKIFKYQILLCVLIFSMGCSSKNNSCTQNNDQSIAERLRSFVNDANQTTFIVELEYKISVNDDFELFYLESDSEKRFSEEKKISKKVNKSADFRSVSFELPKGHFPKKIRLDLGNNNNQEKIIINQISIRNCVNEIIIGKELLPSFFIINKFLSYAPSKGEFKAQSINNRYDPFIISAPLLIQKIKLEF